MEDSNLDALFATARLEAVGVSPALMARVLADAQGVQPVQVSFAPAPKPGFWGGFLTAVGGGPALAGLSTAVLAGLWVGFAQPVALSGVTDMFLASNTVTEPLDIMPAFDDFLIEG